jgi:tetratricopeptide (TPR) repeat protein
MSQAHPNFIGVIKGLEKLKEEKNKKLSRAKFYMESGKFQIAEKKLTALAKTFPQWPEPWTQLGYVEIARNQKVAAKNYFQRALELKPDDPNAIRGLDALIKTVSPDIYEADRAFQAAKYNRASQLYFDYIHHRPTDPLLSLTRVYNRLGWSQYHKGQYELALQKFEKSQSDKAYYIDSIKGRGFTNFQMGNYAEAIRLLNIVHQTYPDDQEVAAKLDGSILRGWNSRRAQSYFEQSLKEFPLRPSLYMGAGWIHYKNRKPDLAVEYFLKAISLDPDFALDADFIRMLKSQRFGWQVYNRLGWTYYHKGEHAKSMDMFQIALKEQPNKSEAKKGMGYNLYRLDKLNQARVFLDQCLAINPDPNPVLETMQDSPVEIETTVRTKLGRIHARLEDYNRAASLFQKVLSLRPAQVDALDGLGWAFLKMNKLAEARAAFTSATRLSPLNASAQRGLTRAKQLIALQNTRKIKPLSISRLQSPSPPATDNPN